MLFMVIERFKDRDPAPIYARLREQDRARPEGLRYVDSWVDANFDRCFQLMECDDTYSLQRWVSAMAGSRRVRDRARQPVRGGSERCSRRPADEVDPKPAS